jgi:hypothetical protein
MPTRSAAEIKKTLVDTAYPYWEAEREIAKRFFAKATKDDHIFYLRAQLWKELHPVDGYFNGLHKELANLVEMFPRVDKDVDRHQFHFSMMQLSQEFNHYVVLADIFEYLLGRKIAARDTVQLPEEKKLGDMRRHYVTSGSAIDRAAVGLTEGGGARLFREGAKLAGNKLATMTARAMKVIYDDEKDHFRVMAGEAAALIKSAKDLGRMQATTGDISRQRVAMRNEMFRRPMTESQIEDFIQRKTRV